MTLSATDVFRIRQTLPAQIPKQCRCISRNVPFHGGSTYRIPCVGGVEPTKQYICTSLFVRRCERVQSSNSSTYHRRIYNYRQYNSCSYSYKQYRTLSWPYPAFTKAFTKVEARLARAESTCCAPPSLRRETPPDSARWLL